LALPHAGNQTKRRRIRRISVKNAAVRGLSVPFQSRLQQTCRRLKRAGRSINRNVAAPLAAASPERLPLRGPATDRFCSVTDLCYCAPNLGAPKMNAKAVYLAALLLMAMAATATAQSARERRDAVASPPPPKPASAQGATTTPSRWGTVGTTVGTPVGQPHWGSQGGTAGSGR
jgi:hypothetical protein